MPDRAAQLIQSLRLAPHPEGGHYREFFRSPHLVTADQGRGDRSALTSIMFLLGARDISRWHAVASDEIWNFYDGEPLALSLLDAEMTRVTRHVLGPPRDGQSPVLVVPAGTWQAAKPTGAYVLAGCAVGPGFEFADFRMMRDEPDSAARLRERQPDLVALL